MSWAVGMPGAPVRMFYSGVDAEALARANARDGEVVGEAEADVGLTLDADGVAGPYDRPGPTLEEAQGAALQGLASRRWTASAAFTYGGVAGVASDDLAQGRLTSTLALMALPGAPISIGWEITPGVFREMTVADLQAFALGMGRHVQGCWARAQAISGEIMAATTVEGVEAVDIGGDWP